MSEDSFKSQEQLVQHKWKTGMCPILNGITFGNGKMIELELTVMPSDDTVLRSQILRETNVETFNTKHADYWTEIISLCEFCIIDRDLRITGGEGGFGSDGFVAVSHISDEQLVWVAFFENSNPFVQISINNNASEILGITTLGHIWQFPIAHPEQVKTLKM